MSQGRRKKEENNKDKKSTKNEKNNPKGNIIFKILAFVYFLITIVFYIAVIQIDMLPTLYTVVFTIAEILFTYLIIRGIAKSRKGYVINIICIIIAILISAVYVYATNYLLATSNFLGNVFKQVTETEQYYIVSKKDSSYTNIEDVEGTDVYLFQIEESVKNDLENKVNVTLKSEQNLTDLGTKLIDDEIDTIFVSLTQYEMLSEEIKGFKENTKIIYIVNHDVKVESVIENTNSEHTIENGIFNVYVSGIDQSLFIGG